MDEVSVSVGATVLGLGAPVNTVIRWSLAAVVVGHGLIHLLGAAKGLGWSAIPQLKEPIGAQAGALWLLAAALVVTVGGLLAAGKPTWWWTLALVAAAVSQLAIITSWSDAKAGTAANIVLVLAAAYLLASVGPGSFHAQWDTQSTQALAATSPGSALVTEADLVDLPGPLAAYIARSGAVGQPRVTSFEATFHGRIRSGPQEAWMPFTGRQVNTYGPRPQRLFIMDATRSGLPVTVLHQFEDATARMRVKVLSLVPVVDAVGPEMNQGETVTVFNDLVVMAPGAIIGAPIRWTAIDDHHVRGVFTDAGQSVTAVLTFDSDHDLVDFVSQDRFRASADGTSFVSQPWSTPLSAHRDLNGRRIFAHGEGRWTATLPDGPFTYLEFDLDDISYNPQHLDNAAAGQPQVPAVAAP
ncbi:DUF6544 family protein [Knoellia sp. S7-12]|uniref:DUF6544 family protein n=1 Tax=Knoellia sp. S7-12 TaxID=3126698 RepID=UPI003366CF44